MKTELIDIVRKLKDSCLVRDNYVKKLPPDFYTLFDNEYVNELEKQIDMMVESLFGDMAEDVFWFLYEYHQETASNGPHLILQNGTEYTFKTNEDYYEYLKNQ